MLKALVVGLVLIIDQVSKYVMDSKLELNGDSISIIPNFFSLSLTYNTGAGFSFLANADGWQRWFFIGLSSVVCLIIFIYLNKLGKNKKFEQISLSLIFAGAIGNVIDRIFHGHVIDFLKVYYQDWVWPIFNLADVAICIGVVMILFGTYDFNKKKVSDH